MSPFSNLRATLTEIHPPRPTFTEANLSAGSQNGRVFVVTGGNAGIGLELVKILYTAGATIYIASRSKAKVDAAITAISNTSNNKNASGKLKYLHLDLNDLEIVKAAAKSFAEQENKLDFEPFIGMHCIATLLFTELLLPQLRAAAAATGKSGKVRVIWTSSGLAEAGSPPNGVDFNIIEAGTKIATRNYGASKAGTWFISREFARRYGKDGIVSACLNPGYLKTASFDGTSAALMFILNRMMLSDAIFGAYTELYAGLSPDLTLEKNCSYIIPWGRIRSNAATPRQDLIEAGNSKEEGGLDYGNKLWAWCEEKWKPYV